jgi:hypothetical protein
VGFLRTAVVASVLALFAGAAEARVFLVVRSGSDAWTVIDPQSVEQTAGSAVRRAVSVTIQKSIAEGGGVFPGYVRTISEYDCQRRVTRWRSLAVYDRLSRRLVARENDKSDWLTPAPGSEVYASLRMVCEGGSGAVISADSVGQVVAALMQAFEDPPPPPPPIRATPTPRLPPSELDKPMAPRPKAKPTPKRK